MKYFGVFGQSFHAASLPVRGAWVEIVCPQYLPVYGRSSLPVRGAWVEIALSTLRDRWKNVAPRAGSVG